MNDTDIGSQRDQVVIRATPVNSLVISVSQLKRSFGKVQALCGMSMSIKRGSITGFLGNNGAGKTTTIHSLLGFIPPDQGTIHVLGFDPQVDPVKIRQRVGFFPERDQPYDWMTIDVLFDMGAAAYPTWNRDLQKKLCEQFSVATEKKIKHLSKGNVAKVKLIFALAHCPELLILDEPTSGLDPASRYELLQMIRQLTTEQNITTLFSSHNLDDVSEIATDLVIIHQGKSILSESVSTIHEELLLIEAKEWTGDPPDAVKACTIKSAQHHGRTYWLIRSQSMDAVDEIVSQQDGVLTTHRMSLAALFLFLTQGWVDLGAKAEVVE